MKNDDASSMFEKGLYIGYMNYLATGEGVTSCICVAGSSERAGKILREKLDPYYHRGIITSLIASGADEEARRMVAPIPSKISTILAEIPVGAGEYYSEFHYNLG